MDGQMFQGSKLRVNFAQVSRGQDGNSDEKNKKHRFPWTESLCKELALLIFLPTCCRRKHNVVEVLLEVARGTDPPASSKRVRSLRSQQSYIESKKEAEHQNTFFLWGVGR